MDTPSNPHEKNLKDSLATEMSQKRPVGLNFLAFLMILAIIFAFITISTLPGTYRYLGIDEIEGYPFLELTILFLIISVILLIILTICLLSGEEWARKTVIMFFIVGIINSLMHLNIIVIIFAIITIFYLSSSKVKKFFTRESRLNKTIVRVLIGVTVLVLTFNIISSIILVIFKPNI
jgi:hypothetical protein